jgi:hypothetical protein
MGLTMADLFPGGNGQQDKPQIVAADPYCYEKGKPLYEAVRFVPKDFRQRRPDGEGKWVWNMQNVRRVLYRLPELMAADPSAIVFVVEGEKDVCRLVQAGLVATCNVGGAGKWQAEYNEFLRGRRVVVIADRDEPGRKHARQVAESLSNMAVYVRVLELPGDGVKDAFDWFAGGGSAEQLLALAGQAPVFTPTTELVRTDAGDADEQETIEVTPWREPLADPGFHGLAGEIVRAIEPHTEANPAALLIQVLIAQPKHFSCVLATGMRSIWCLTLAARFGRLRSS